MNSLANEFGFGGAQAFSRYRRQQMAAGETSHMDISPAHRWVAFHSGTIRQSLVAFFNDIFHLLALSGSENSFNRLHFFSPQRTPTVSLRFEFIGH